MPWVLQVCMSIMWGCCQQQLLCTHDCALRLTVAVAVALDTLLSKKLVSKNLWLLMCWCLPGMFWPSAGICFASNFGLCIARRFSVCPHKARCLHMTLPYCSVNLVLGKEIAASVGVNWGRQSELMFCIPAGCPSSKVCHILCRSPNQRQEPLLHLQRKGHTALHTHHWRQGLCQRGKTGRINQSRQTGHLWNMVAGKNASFPAAWRYRVQLLCNWPGYLNMCHYVQWSEFQMTKWQDPILIRHPRGEPTALSHMPCS